MNNQERTKLLSILYSSSEKQANQAKKIPPKILTLKFQKKNRINNNKLLLLSKYITQKDISFDNKLPRKSVGA